MNNLIILFIFLFMFAMTSKNFEYAGTIDAKVLLALKKRTTKKGLSPVLEYVFVSDWYVAWTDNLIMEYEKTNIKDWVLIDVDFIPKKFTFWFWEEIEVYQNDERVEMRNPNFVIKTKKPDQQYYKIPWIKKIIDNFENTKEKIIFDPKDIVEDKTISFKIDWVYYECDKRRRKELKKIIWKEVEFSEMTWTIRIWNLIIRLS